MNKETLKILIVEDNEDDLALLLRELDKGKFKIEYESVEDADSFKSALKKKWDIIISDYSLPNFNGFDALNICNEIRIDTPFIVVSGTVGEDIATDMMRAGCKDYIMKKSLKRLLPAVEREIEDSKIRETNRLIAKEKEVLFEINQDILNTASLDELLKRIHNNISKVIFAENCFISIYNSEKDEISYPYFVDKFDIQPSPCKKDKGFTEYVLETGFPLIVNPENAEKIAKINKLELPGIVPESWLGIPLISHSGPIGVLAVVSYRKDIKYTDIEKDFLSGIANQIALAIERKQTEQSLKESEEHYRTLLTAIPDLMFRLDGDGRFIDYHADDSSILFASPKEFLGKHYKEILSPDTAKKLEDTIEKIKETNEIGKFEYELTLPGNSPHNYEARLICYGEECIAIIRDVTDQKNAQKALIESEKKYRTIFENVQDIFYQTDNRGIILDISPSIFKYSGYAREELIGKSVDLFYFNQGDRIKFLKDIETKKQVTDYEVMLKSKSGKIKYTSVNAQVYYDFDGNPLGVEGSLRDVSERKRIEQALKESEERYRKLYELSPETIFVTCEGNIEFINQAGVKLFKAKSENDIIGKKILDFVHPDYKKMVSERISVLEKDFTDVPLLEEKYICMDGSLVDVEVIATPFIYKSKRAALVVLRDITERKKSEEALKESEERYRILIETMHDGVMQVDNDDRIQFVNNSMCEILGYTYHELVGKIGVDTIIYKEDRETVWEKNRIRMAGVSDKYEIRGVKKTGEIIWLSISGTPIGDKDGNVVGSVGFLSDVTERKRAEEEVIKISQAIKQSPVTILITDINGDIEYINPKFIEVTGYRPEEVIGKNPRILKSGEMPENVYKKLWDTILSGNDWVGEFRNKKKNGELFWENVSISPVKNSEGKITHFLAIKEDITEKKQKEIELINAKEKAEESERLKSSFLANMSHELRTPMVGILGFAELMKDIADNPELKDFADNITKSGKRLLETLNLILDLSRIEAGKLELKTTDVDIVQLSKEVYENFIKEAEKKKLRIIFSTSEEVLLSKIDERMLWESLNNLVNNAIKYTKVGEVRIEVGTDKNKNIAFIKVKDTGIGIPKDLQKTIFEEFRQVSEGYSRGFEGTGLGLTITKNFTEKIGGKISIESDIGVGSIFTIELPLLKIHSTISPVKEANRIIEEKKPVIENKDLYILCVDDDLFTREYLEYILKNIYKISFANNGLSAIEMSKSNKFSLVLMDINLGKGMDGIETTRKIRKLPGYENIPVIAMTAFAMKGEREEFLDSGMNDYISKPFKSVELIEIIEKVIGSLKS